MNAVLPGFLATHLTRRLELSPGDRIVRRTALDRLGGVADIVPRARLPPSPDSWFIMSQYIIIDGGATG